MKLGKNNMTCESILTAYVIKLPICNTNITASLKFIDPEARFPFSWLHWLLAGKCWDRTLLVVLATEVSL
jgi:hypothetical protein